MLDFISKSLGLEKMGLPSLDKLVPSLKKAFELATERGDKGFMERAAAILDTFTSEMENLDKDKKAITEKTQKKAEKTIETSTGTIASVGGKPKETPNISVPENLSIANEKVLRKAISVAMDPNNEGLSNAEHCWDWVSKIYREAGVKRKKVFWTIDQYNGKNCGDFHAGEEQYASLKPGDHIFYNLQKDYDAQGKGRNAVDSHGNHSAIFIKWLDEGQKIAQVASGSCGTKWHMHKNPINFNKTPVTAIFKPVEV